MAHEFILFCIPLTQVVTTDTFGTQSQWQPFVAGKLIFIPFPLTDLWQILFKERTCAAVLLIRLTEVLYGFLSLAATIQQGRRNYPAMGSSTQSLSLNSEVMVCPVLVQTQWILIFCHIQCWNWEQKRYQSWSLHFYFLFSGHFMKYLWLCPTCLFSPALVAMRTHLVPCLPDWLLLVLLRA